MFDGADVGAPRRRLRELRRRLQPVFQDPFGVARPALDDRAQVARAARRLRASARRPSAATAGRASCSTAVGLGPAHAPSLPARALGRPAPAVGDRRARSPPSPSCIVADEPVSALDVSVQAQILNLLAELRGDHGLADHLHHPRPRRRRALADRVAVMYLGRIVESGPTDRALRRPAAPVHPGAARRRPAPRPDWTHAGPRRCRRDPEPDRPAERVPLPPALPARRRPVPHRAPRAAGLGPGRRTASPPAT